MDKNELDFNDYTEEQLAGVLRFTRSIGDANAELNAAVEAAREYAKKRNKGLSGRMADDSPEQNEIQEQVDNWLKRTKRK